MAESNTGSSSGIAWNLIRKAYEAGRPIPVMRWECARCAATVTARATQVSHACPKYGRQAVNFNPYRP